MTARRAWPITIALGMVGVLFLVPGVTAGTSLTAAAIAEVQGNPKGAPKAKEKQEKDKKEKEKGPDHDTKIIVVDRDGHSRVVRQYATRGHLPPGLAKRRTLPPGLSKQLREKGALPPGLRDYYTPVPADWNAQLPGIPSYYSRYFVGRDLIIIDTRNDTLVSLIRDLLD